MKQIKLIVVIILCVFSASSSFAGLSYYDKDVHKLRYEVKGEIEVKPNKTVLPVIITTKAKSNKDSLLQAENVMSDINKELSKLDGAVFSLSPLDFYKPDKSGMKSLDISFFGRNEDISKTRIVAYIYVQFNDDHQFWDRSRYVAEALDFIKNISNKYKKDDNIAIYLDETFYEIDNIEQYRDEIVKSVYKKAKLMAQLIAKQEKLKPKIKYVSFDQHIKEDIINFSKAHLTIDAVIEYAFE